MTEQKEQIEAVQRMQDYIDSHQCEMITSADLARASYYSPWHSYRLFVRWLNVTPADYIRRLRLSRSAIKLRDEGIKIIDAAFDAGFCSVDGYQRAFHREFGCNPRDFTVKSIPIRLFVPYGIRYSAARKEITSMENVKNVFIQLIEKPARKALIKRGLRAQEYFSYCEEVGCDVWGLLMSVKSIGGEPVCLWLPPAYIKPGTSRYVQGVEVPADFDGIVPEGYDTIDLPACQYLMFQGEPFAEEDYAQAIDQISAAIEKYDPSVIGYTWDKANPRVQLEPIGARGYIELLPVKKRK